MSQYYFLVASLPLLSYEEREAMEPAEFLTMLEDHLTEPDLALVRSATIDAPLEATAPSGTTAQRWIVFERGLRNLLVRMRAGTKNVDPEQYIRLDETDHDNTEPLEIGEAAREAFSQESPLSGEDTLNRARWTFLDDLEVGHYFDLDRIVIYYLRLQLLARRRLFTRKNGEERFAAINEQIMNDYYQEHNE